VEDLLLRLSGDEVHDQWVAREIPFDDARVAEAAGFVGDMWFDDGNVLGGRAAIAETSVSTTSPPAWRPPGPGSGLRRPSPVHYVRPGRRPGRGLR
jgi:hypothetical protein